jgi:protein TonB
MAQVLTMRATSLAASTAILGAAVLAALSFSYTVANFALPSLERSIVVIAPEPPAPPPAAPAPPPMRPTLPNEMTAPVIPAPPTEFLAPISSGDVEAAPGPVLVEDPRWLQRPRDLARYYPPRAIGRGVEGEAVLDCLVSRIGTLSCAVVSETPAGWGFGAAAVQIAEDHRMVPATRDGQPVEGRYRMRTPFRLN